MSLDGDLERRKLARLARDWARAEVPTDHLRRKAHMAALAVFLQSIGSYLDAEQDAVDRFFANSHDHHVSVD